MGDIVRPLAPKTALCSYFLMFYSANSLQLTVAEYFRDEEGQDGELIA